MAKKIIRYWTEEESYYVYKNFNQRSLKEISVTLDRSYASIRAHSYEIASKKDWTEYEELLGNGKVCPKCGIRYLLNSINWHRNKSNKNGFHNYCKKCTNEMKFEERKERAKLAVRKQLDEMTKRMTLEEIKRIKTLGLDITKVNLELGQVYKIKNIERNIPKIFEVKLIQICDKHLVFKHKSGRCESFLKVDLLLKEYEVVM